MPRNSDDVAVALPTIVVPGDRITLESEKSEKILKVIDLLEDLEDVQNVFHNAEI